MFINGPICQHTALFKWIIRQPYKKLLYPVYSSAFATELMIELHCVIAVVLIIVSRLSVILGVGNVSYKFQRFKKVLLRENHILALYKHVNW